jgi:hypothetical protein
MHITKKAITIHVLVLFAAALVSCSSGTKSESFVTFCTGSATFQRGSGAVTQLQVKDQVQDGDVIRTGDKSYVVIQSTDGLVLRIEQKSEVAISAFNTVAKREITLSRGKVLSSVAKLKKDSEYKVKTPTTIASVRGTEFLTEFNGKRSIVAVGSGKVSVERSAGNPDLKIVDKGSTAVVEEQKEIVSMRKINRLETLELSKITKTPVVEGVEKKTPEEIKAQFIDSVKADEKVNFDIKGETSGFTVSEMKDNFKRVDVVILFNGRVIQGIIVSRGETYRIVTANGPVEVNAREVRRTEVK